MDYVKGYEKARTAAERAGGTDKIWGTMIYACGGKNPGVNSTGCGFERRVGLGLGVEGPPALRDAGAYVPSPMFAGACPDCGGYLFHDRWIEDETFEPRDREPGEPVFRVPAKGRAKRLASRGYGGGELVEGDAD